MQEAVTTAARTIAVLSPAYFGSRFGEAEWRAAFAADPSGERGLLVPVRVQPCEPPGLLATRVYVDLVDLDETSARERLLAAVGPAGPAADRRPVPRRPADRGRAPTVRPVVRARFPGAGPAVSNLPAAQPELLRPRRAAGRGCTPAAGRRRSPRCCRWRRCTGWVGSARPSWRWSTPTGSRSDYDIIWWIPAEQPATAAAALAGLAGRLGVPAAADQAEMVAALFDLLRGRDRWLLIYDNAEQPDRAAPGCCPPAGAGSVLVTSRWSAWGRQADPLRLDVLAREESVQFLTAPHRRRDDRRAGASWRSWSGICRWRWRRPPPTWSRPGVGLGEYLELAARPGPGAVRPGPGRGHAGGRAGAEADQRRVATVWSVSLDRVRTPRPGRGGAAEACARSWPRRSPATCPPSSPEVLPDRRWPRWWATRLAYNRTLRRRSAATRWSTLDPDDDRGAPAGAGGDPGPARPGPGTGLGRRPRSRCCGRRSRTTAGRPAPGPDCERLLPHLLAVASTPNGSRSRGKRPGGCSTGPRPTCGNAASTGRPSRWPNARSPSPRPRSAPITSTWPWRRDELGRVLQELGDLRRRPRPVRAGPADRRGGPGPRPPRRRHLAQQPRRACCRTWGTWPAPAPSSSGPCRSARRPWAPTTPTSAPGATTSAACCRTWGTWPAPAPSSSGPCRSARRPWAPTTPTSASGAATSAACCRTWGTWPAPAPSSSAPCRSARRPWAPTTPTSASGATTSAACCRTWATWPAPAPSYERALQISEAALGPDHPDVGIRRNNLGRVLQDLGDLAGARTQLRARPADQRGGPGPRPPHHRHPAQQPRRRAAGPGGPGRRPHPVRAGPADQRGGPGPRPPADQDDPHCTGRAAIATVEGLGRRPPCWPTFLVTTTGPFCVTPDARDRRR